MGYTTDFDGKFYLNKKLGPKINEFLKNLTNSRRMKRNLGPEFGIDGEFYVSDDYFGDKDSIVDSNTPPLTQPSLNLGWIPSDNGMSIIWDGGEKFYDYETWLVYLITKILKPNGYILNGTVKYYGEDTSDIGLLVVKDNVLFKSHGIIVREIKVEDVRKYSMTDRGYINNFIKPDVVHIIKEDE